MDKKAKLKKLEKQFNSSNLAEVCYRDGRIRNVPLDDGIREFLKGTAYHIELPRTPAEEKAVFEYNANEVHQAVEEAKDRYRKGIPYTPPEPLTDPESFDHAEVSYRDGTKCFLPLKEAAVELKSGRAYAVEVYLPAAECLKLQRTQHHACVYLMDIVKNRRHGNGL